jgi:hypothetical protein
MWVKQFRRTRRLQTCKRGNRRHGSLAASQTIDFHKAQFRARRARTKGKTGDAMSSPQVATGDRIVDPTITLAGCSTRQPILVAGSKSVELMLELHRRGYLLAAAAGMRRRNRRPWYIDPIPSYYGYDGDWHYFGRPGF